MDSKDWRLLSIQNVATIGLLTISALYLYQKYKSRTKNLPPGPLRLPVIGTIASHGFGPSDFAKLHEKYGDIFTVYGGNTCVIVLNSYDVITEAFTTKYKNFSARGYAWMTQTFNPEKAGFVCADYSPEFQQRRSKALNVLRSLGFGTSIMENKIKFETVVLREEFETKSGEAFDPNAMLNAFVANIMFGILYNERNDTKTTSHIDEQVEKFFRTGMEVVVCDFFPVARHLPFLKETVKSLLDSHDAIMDHVRTKVHEHLKSHVPGQCTDFLHAFIDEHLDPETNEFNADVEHLVYMLRDLVFAGLETTATSMKWLLLLLANYREIQAIARAEIDALVGKDREVCLSDREQLPYVEALIMEAQRYKTIAPYGLQHHAVHNATLAGYDIPARAVLMPMIAHVHMDKNTWGDPHVFRPERFIDANGRYTRHSRLIPFSTGKRQCFGEILARKELFFFVTSVLQHFTILPPEGVNKISEEGHPSFTYSPLAYQIRAVAS